jgi:hypothetical protein
LYPQVHKESSKKKKKKKSIGERGEEIDEKLATDLHVIVPIEGLAAYGASKLHRPD